MWTSVTECCNKIVHQITRRKSVRKLSRLVLYVCERVSNNVGGAMAAARERSSSRYATPRSVQKDLSHGFPIQVSLPDGETSCHQYNPSLRSNGGELQETEMMRSYVKPPANKSLSDMEGMSTNSSCSMGMLGMNEEWEGGRSYSTAGPGGMHPQRSYSTTSSPHSQHRHSTPLDPHNTYHPHYSTRGRAGAGVGPGTPSSFSLSSSSSSMSSSSAVGGSPRGRKGSIQMQFLTTFLSPRDKPAHEGGGGRRQSRSGGSRAPCNPHSILRNPSATPALADIAVVPCDAADSPSNFPSDLGHDEHMQLPQGIYGHHLQNELAPHGMEDNPPPIYSEVIENPSLYRNASRPERRTNSGKI